MILENVVIFPKNSEAQEEPDFTFAGRVKAGPLRFFRAVFVPITTISKSISTTLIRFKLRVESDDPSEVDEFGNVW